MKRILVALLLTAVAALLALGAIGYLLGRPVPADIGPPPVELGAVDVTFASTSGSVIHGWFAASGARDVAVLLLPGVRANRTHMTDRARFLRRAGFPVLLIDFQATGESTGRRITFGALESRDVLAAVGFLRRHLPRHRVVIIGSSLGGVASLLATPPLRVDGLVLEAVFPTISKATENRFTMRLSSAGRIPAAVLLRGLKANVGVSPDDLRPVDHIAAVHCPVLIIAGETDRHTTQDDSKELFSAARPPKALWVVPGAGHVDYHAVARAEYEERVLAFLNQISPISRPGSG